MRNGILYFTCFSSMLFASDNLFIADPHFSPYAGGEDLLTVHRIAECIEDWAHDPNSPSRSWRARGERFLELFLAWDPFNQFTMVVQHEVFGHGYRIRNIGKSTVKVTSYKFGWPPPYAHGGGATEYEIHPSKLTTLQQTAISSGGVEATAILANRLKLKWLSDRTIDPRAATLYLDCQQDLTQYVLGMEDSDKKHDGHDISSYLYWLHQSLPSGELSRIDLKRRALINLLDPFTYFSIYSWFRFIFSGKPMTIPMIPIKGVGYLPGARLGLTPFGPEYYFENYFVAASPIYAYLKWGSYASQTTYGCGLEWPEIFLIHRCTFGLRFDAWNQPRPLFRDPAFAIDALPVSPSAEEDLHHKRFGLAAYLISYYPFGRRNAGLYLQLGGKSKGFLPGESLEQAVIVRLGFQAKF